MTEPLAGSPLDAALEGFTARTGLTFPDSRRLEFAAGVRRVLARHGERDLADLTDRIGSDRRLVDELVDELAVQETYFFREPAQFDTIRRAVLPNLASERGPGATFNAWSLGCASGEEPYSLAILLEQEGVADRWRVLAGDISRAALAKAAKGSYGKWSFRGCPDDLIARYFRARADRQVLAPRIRERVTFEPVNLAADAFGPTDRRFDLILCRNVLIYFQPDLVGALARKLYDCLSDGGWLITAPSDPPLWTLAPFAVQTSLGGALYRKTPVTVARPAEIAPAAPRTARASPAPLKRSAPRAAVSTELKPRGGATPAPEGRPAPDVAARLRSIKALANSGQAERAERLAQTSVAADPTSVELHYLRAVLLLGLNRPDEAIQAVRRVLYLDRTLVAAHLLLASVLRGRKDDQGALRAYRTALDCCAGRASEDLARLADGESIGRLAQAAAAGIAALQVAGGGRP